LVGQKQKCCTILGIKCCISGNIGVYSCYVIVLWRSIVNLKVSSRRIYESRKKKFYSTCRNNETHVGTEIIWIEFHFYFFWLRNSETQANVMNGVMGSLTVGTYTEQPYTYYTVVLNNNMHYIGTLLYGHLSFNSVETQQTPYYPYM